MKEGTSVEQLYFRYAQENEKLIKALELLKDIRNIDFSQIGISTVIKNDIDKFFEEINGTAKD